MFSGDVWIYLFFFGILETRSGRWTLQDVPSTIRTTPELMGLFFCMLSEGASHFCINVQYTIPWVGHGLSYL